MPEERASAYSGNKRPHNQLGLVPVKKLKSELSTRIVFMILMRNQLVCFLYIL